MDHTYAVLFSMVVAILVIFFLHHRRRHSTSIKHPYSYPIIGVAFDYFRNLHRMMDWTVEYLQSSPTHTTTFTRPGYKPFVMTANPVNVEHILKTNFENYPKGNHIEAVFRDLLGDGIFTADGDLWKLQRKVASFEFTTKSLREYFIKSLQLQVSQSLIPTLNHFCGSQIDMQDIFQRFGFDNICKFAFGVDPNSLDASLHDVKFAVAFETALKIITSRYYEFHPIIWKIKRFFCIGSERRLRESLQVVDEFASTIIAGKRKLLKEIKEQEDAKYIDGDLLSRFIHIKNESLDEIEKEWTTFTLDVNKFLGSDKFVRDIVISFILAGKDTAAVAMTWLFWILATHPHVESNICKEVEQIIVRRNNGKETCRTWFSYEELKEMHYLHAAILESMRLYPPVPLDTKEAKNDDLLPDGTPIVKGAKVTYHVFAMGRSTSLWGEDCLEFKPERWLKDGLFVGVNPYKYPIFQAGPRICIGKDMAMIQMKYICASILPNFRFLVDKDFYPKYGLDITLKMLNKFQVIVQRKEHL